MYFLYDERYWSQSLLKQNIYLVIILFFQFLLISYDILYKSSLEVT